MRCLRPAVPTSDPLIKLVLPSRRWSVLTSNQKSPSFTARTHTDRCLGRGLQLEPCRFEKVHRRFEKVHYLRAQFRHVIFQYHKRLPRFVLKEADYRRMKQNDLPGKSQTKYPDKYCDPFPPTLGRRPTRAKKSSIKKALSPGGLLKTSVMTTNLDLASLLVAKQWKPTRGTCRLRNGKTGARSDPKEKEKESYLLVVTALRFYRCSRQPLLA